VGRLKHEALREEVHCFDVLTIPEAAPTASAQIASQPCTCCNAIYSSCSIFGGDLGQAGLTEGASLELALTLMLQSATVPLVRSRTIQVTSPTLNGIGAMRRGCSAGSSGTPSFAAPDTSSGFVDATTLTPQRASVADSPDLISPLEITDYYLSPKPQHLINRKSRVWQDESAARHPSAAKLTIGARRRSKRVLIPG
jgi:hypothetical protein